MNLNYRKGDRVRHPGKQEWGIGEVLLDAAADTVKIFFVEAGEKTLSLKYVQPVKVTGDEAKHPVLDNLKVRTSSSGPRYRSLSESVGYFLEQYPEGFHGELFERDERGYKDKARELGAELLNQREFMKLLEQDECSEICRRALKLVNATNLIFPNEKMALKDGLKNTDSEAAFSTALGALLYGEGELRSRFEGFSNVLEDLEAAKWTTASYFPFFLRPDHFIFIKPTVTQYAAELCGFEISYQPKLNWVTYTSVLRFAEYLKDAIAELKPRDMIDVQSFMWCIARTDT